MLKKIRFDTIRSRFALIVSVAVVGCMFSVLLSSYLIQRQTVREHSQATMQIANERISLELEDDYKTLFQVSRMMVSSGMVGREFNAYLMANNYMDRYETYTNISEMIRTITFSTDCKLAIYYDTVNCYNHMEMAYLLEENFDPENIPKLVSTAQITYHAKHNSMNRYSNVPVVSLVRDTTFLGDDNMIIFLEKETGIDTILEDYQKNLGYSFIFLQLDDDGNICYSNAEIFPVGMKLERLEPLEDNFGKWGNYFWISQECSIGGQTILLLDRNNFYGDVHLQMYFLLLAVFLSVLLVVLAVVLLNRLIIKKNVILQQEIERVGEGNLGKVTQHTGLQDYDLLLERFDWMVEQLQRQMRMAEDAERRKGDIEREILYYQINPHFLLNSLNSAYWQARMNVQGGIDQYLAQLTGILRYSLGKDIELPSLEKEVEILRLYLQLQTKRYDFTYSLDVEEGDYLKLSTPRLFIQPIVENSIEHGMDEGDHIAIRVYREGGVGLRSCCG